MRSLMILLLLLSSLWNSTLRTKRTSLFQRLFKSSSKLIRDLIKLQSVPAVAKFYLSGTSTNMSSHVEGKSMGKGLIAISVEKLPRPLMDWSSIWSVLIRSTPENSVWSYLKLFTQETRKCSSYFFGFFIQFVECFGQVTMILKYLSGSLELQNAMQKYLINISINIQFQFLFCNVVSSIAVYELLHRQTTQIGWRWCKLWMWMNWMNVMES